MPSCAKVLVKYSNIPVDDRGARCVAKVLCVRFDSCEFEKRMDELEARPLRLARPTRRVNWRKVSECNVDGLARRGDAHTLLSFADDVAHGDAGAVQSDTAHPSVAKAFALSQLTVQYLLHTQQVLIEGNSESDAARARAQEALASVKGKLKTQKENMRHLARERARQEELIESYRALLHTLNPKAARRADVQTGRESASDRRRRRRRARRKKARSREDRERRRTAMTGRRLNLRRTSLRRQKAKIRTLIQGSTARLTLLPRCQRKKTLGTATKQ